MITTTDRGCCDTCNGTGRVMDPDANGLCWDCRGTGHLHPAEVSCK
jgi:DnaJ-class molecular chaperone